MNILWKCGGESIFFTHTNWQNAPFAQFIPPPWMPLLHDSPLLPWKLPAPWGEYPFLTKTPEGGAKFLQRLPRGRGMHCIWALFPRKYHPPPTRNSEQSLSGFFFSSILIFNWHRSDQNQSSTVNRHHAMTSTEQILIHSVSDPFLVHLFLRLEEQWSHQWWAGKNRSHSSARRSQQIPCLTLNQPLP